MSFRIDSKQGLKQENISAAQNLAGLLQKNEAFCVNLKCTLVVRQRLNFGESLYIRGKPGDDFTVNKSILSWNRGIQLQNQGPDTWSAPIEINIGKYREVAFKFLVNDNDKQWENGENHDLQDLLFLAQNSLSITPKAGNYAKERVQKNMHCESQNLQFRVNPQDKLSQEQILKAKNLATDFEGNPLLSVRLTGDLIVRRQLKFGESLYIRGELTQGDQLPFQREIGHFSVHNLMFVCGWENLSWRKGVKLQNVNADTWFIPFTLRVDNSHKINFKFLIDDKQWEDGENHNLQDLLFLAQTSKEYEKQQQKCEDQWKQTETKYEKQWKKYEEQWKQTEAKWNSPFNTSSFNFGPNMSFSYTSPFNSSSFNFGPNMSFSYTYTPRNTSSNNFNYAHNTRPNNNTSSSNSNYSYSNYSHNTYPNNNTSSSNSNYSYNARPNNTSSNNYSSYSSSSTSSGYVDPNKEANEIKAKLERILGATISDANSLSQAFKKWSIKNHPDKHGNDTTVTKTFQEVVELRNKLKELKRW
jgi:hypothetical protein